MRLNSAATAEKKYTHEGALAPLHVKPVQELRRAVMTCLLWEDSFYESGQSIVERIQTLVPKVAPLEVKKIAIDARNVSKLRHVPLLLACEMAKLSTHREYVSDLLYQVIQRADELAEVLAIYQKGRTGVKKLNKLSHQVQKGLARAFRKFNEFQLARYNKDSEIKLRDVLFLCHAKPKDDEQAALWKRLIDGKLETPDTWEVKLSAGKGEGKKESWTRLLEEGKLGALALLRNLRNMNEAGVEERLIRNAVINMQTEKVLPFRFIAAARYAPRLEPELEIAMTRCVSALPKLKGRTALIVDTSPSMWLAKISGKSDMNRFEAAAALAILARETCEDTDVYWFNQRAGVVPARRGFALRDALAATKGCSSIGGLAVQLANETGYDRVICLTDGEWHPISAAPSNYNSVKSTDLSAGPAPLAGKPAYMLNVSVEQNGVGYGPWTQIDGWSEGVIEYIRQSEEMMNGNAN